MHAPGKQAGLRKPVEIYHVLIKTDIPPRSLGPYPILYAAQSPGVLKISKVTRMNSGPIFQTISLQLSSDYR